MNIITQPVQAPVPTATNPSTDALRRDNIQREVITQPAASQQSAAEKGVASERERARTPSQNNEQIDFEQLRQQAERASSTISDDTGGTSEQQQQQNEDNAAERNDESNDENESIGASNQDTAEPDFADQQIIKELQLRDREVRSHEQAHAAAGGPYTGAPSYTFEVGPDGKKYAVEGEVSVDLSPVKGDPQATITKLQKVYNAALAPANPSIQDTRIANKAAQLIAEAQSQLLAESFEEGTGNKPSLTRASVNESFSQEAAVELNDESREFDQQINATLKAQESIAPSRPSHVEQAAVVVASLYAEVNQAYTKPPRYQFELTA